MPVSDIYSKRNKLPVDVFIYDKLPNKLRIQVIYIWRGFFEYIDDYYAKSIWKTINDVIREEHGKKTLLADSYGYTYHDSYRVEYYFENLTNVEEAMDVIEVVFRIISKTPKIMKEKYNRNIDTTLADNAIIDLNTRFLENGLGYEFQDGIIIRVDNVLLHTEIIIPTLHFLSSQTFKNANDEFLTAHEHFRNKRQKECLAECLKAIETTMKIICTENNWSFIKTDTAKKLLDICFTNKLIPDYLQSHFTALKSVLESGAPTLRNKLGGHGQGTDKIIVPDHYASYMLYLTGSTINFLVSCQRELKAFN